MLTKNRALGNSHAKSNAKPLPRTPEIRTIELKWATYKRLRVIKYSHEFRDFDMVIKYLLGHWGKHGKN